MKRCDQLVHDSLVGRQKAAGVDLWTVLEEVVGSGSASEFLECTVGCVTDEEPIVNHGICHGDHDGKAAEEDSQHTNLIEEEDRIMKVQSMKIVSYLNERIFPWITSKLEILNRLKHPLEQLTFRPEYVYEEHDVDKGCNVCCNVQVAHWSPIKIFQ